MVRGQAMARLVRLVHIFSGALLILWLLPGGFLAFLAASVTMPVDGSLWTHPAFRDWLRIGIPLAAIFLAASAARLVRRHRRARGDA